MKNKREGARCPADALRDYDEVAKVLPFAAISMLAHDLASALRDTLAERDRLAQFEECFHETVAEHAKTLAKLDKADGELKLARAVVRAAMAAFFHFWKNPEANEAVADALAAYDQQPTGGAG